MNPVEDMQIFKRIVEAGSISKAADQLDTVKSAVSRRLKELEKRLNVTLLQRTTRRQMLTEAGQRYYQSCLRLLDDIAEAEARVAENKNELQGRLRIAVPLTFGLEHMAPALMTFQQRHPQIELDVDFSDKFVDLVADGFDLAIRISQQLADSSMRAKRLSQSRIIVCASPDYLAEHGYPSQPEDLNDGHTTLHYRSRHESWAFQKNGESIEVAVNGGMLANNGQFLCQAAVNGRGIIRSPDFICYQAINSGQLVRVLNEFQTNDTVGIYAVTPGSRYLPRRCEVLIEFLQETFADNSPWLQC
ncbi:LysR family transcriptional regulator [Methylophaga sp. OBS3]|uniref:LysR family transcriptional regulator n=1 Tax=Methylophaga sp. OBS3 TaxID=2991934 RepID=UPI002259BC73|nr:LysR family transcriptional regulator [Methylophaga sp. OBS3]MCX4189045.1 LysR family transcriptional regulator [Methylophaga sp. OBS3]